MDVYIGIDVSKTSHYAAFLSKPLLHRHKKYDACPTLKFTNSRDGFVALLEAMTAYTAPDQCHILMESTGHYGHGLEQYLQEQHCHLYRIQGQKRYTSKNKTDKSDAQSLAALLYNQVGLQVIAVDEQQRIRPLIPSSDVARQLRGLIQHRTELTRESTRRKNKLIAICDELFPELIQIYKDTNSLSALTLREAFPTPQAIAQASPHQLVALRHASYPSRDQLIVLQNLARATIGTQDLSRQQSLVFQQSQLIAELRLLTKHLDQLDETITRLVNGSREGQILTSFCGIGPTHAAILLSLIGNIANFESANHLRGYLGWAPRQTQTGTSIDSTILNKAGNPLAKQTVFLIVFGAITHDPTWKALYNDMVEHKCARDAKTGKHRGKMKVIGHIAGKIIELIYVLLRKDAHLLASLNPGEIAPDPALYDPAKHHQRVLSH